MPNRGRAEPTPVEAMSHPEVLAVQYGDDRNLSARQAIWRYRDPPASLAEWSLDLAGLAGDETVLDVGCGNGLYPAALARRSHRGVVIGLDRSEGMLASVARSSPQTRRMRGDADTLPIRDAAVDVVLAMHMLYHVREPADAARQLRRVLRPGGIALATTNGAQNFGELDDLIVDAAQTCGFPVPRIDEMLRSFSLENGAAVLRHAFEAVERHDLPGRLVVPKPEFVAGYAASQSRLGVLPDAARRAVIDEVHRRATQVIERQGVLITSVVVGCFRCR